MHEAGCVEQITNSWHRLVDCLVRMLDDLTRMFTATAKAVMAAVSLLAALAAAAGTWPF
jgi:hypothetical protein